MTCLAGRVPSGLPAPSRMKILLLIVLGLAGAVILVLLGLYLAGSCLPREHRAQVTVILPARRDVVWAALTDYAAFPQWWPAVKSVRFERRADGTEFTWVMPRKARNCQNSGAPRVRSSPATTTVAPHSKGNTSCPIETSNPTEIAASTRAPGPSGS